MSIIRFVLSIVVLVGICSVGTSDERPNILWITSEDNGPHLGCYGDQYSTTPKLDALAKQGCVYLHAWSNAPVCAPARTALITGMYPTSLGAEHMRTLVPMPKGTKMFPQLLRSAGYYCTNNSKEDYNVIKPGKIWDQSNRKAHWKNRPDDKPFFAVFNFTVSHESRIRKRPHRGVHDPAKVRVPKYHPDTPEVRKDWAQYYDKITEMDQQAGKKLKELAEAGLTDDTIVFYFGDHGSGMPRSKRHPSNSGLSVPLIVYVPEKFKNLRSKDYQAGGKSDRLVSFVDFGPTVLSLAGIEPPKYMQGSPFLGKFEAKPKSVIFGFRGRMDERYDLVRVARNKRYVYVRNFYPQRIYGQHINYQFQTPTTRIWKSQFDKGQLNADQERFWSEKPTEELYDLQNDPDEVSTLIADRHPELKQLRNAVRTWCKSVQDVGFIPESELYSWTKNQSPRDGITADRNHDLSTYIDTAYAATERGNRNWNEFSKWLKSDSAVKQFWALQAVDIQGVGIYLHLRKEIEPLSKKASPSVKVLANYLIAKYESENTRDAIERLVELCDLDKQHDVATFMALNTINLLGAKAKPFQSKIEALPRKAKSPTNKRVSGYPSRLLDHITKNLRSTENKKQ